ncbi:MAG TPA: hypothetical protein VGH86_13490 [Phenylobacterium sp.]|jgi:hypothetical protein
MRRLIAVVGALAIMLGGLWLLQGLGAVRLRPILCFADCEPVQGPSTTWALIGAVVVLAGIWAMFRALKR